MTRHRMTRHLPDDYRTVNLTPAGAVRRNKQSDYSGG